MSGTAGRALTPTACTRALRCATGRQSAWRAPVAGPSAPRAVSQSRRGYASSNPTVHPSGSLHPAKPGRYGQPLHTTHPHLVRKGQLTPGVPGEEYETRRRKLMASLPEGSVVVCMGGTVRLVSQQIFYKFRQATDFFYLSGFDEPDATMILESNSSPRGYKYTLFVPPKDPHEALWAGECSGVDGATEIFGADEAYPNTSLSSYLPSFLRAEHLFCSLPPSPSPSQSSQPFHPPPPRKRSSLLKLFQHDPSSSTGLGSEKDPPHLLIAAALASERARPLEREVQRLRVIKSARELDLMKRAADVSADAHTKVMRYAHPGVAESQLAAVFEYHCALAGSERPAYVPVVASGANALVIHYTNNNCLLDPDDLILIDAGCELHHYASDITRTFPASGRFTAPQRDLYEAVLNVQKECVKRCKIEDEVNLNELHRASCVMLTTELRQIGFRLSTGDVERKLYPHFLSHHLGSDLHDCPTTDRSTTYAQKWQELAKLTESLTEGMVVTIEPGIYVPFDNAFPSAFHGLGIRIEDEVAFTKDGPLVLSANAPKEIVDVEGACQGVLE